MNANWRLKPGYRENLTRGTWEGTQPGSYWNAERLSLCGDYQFDVYLLARRRVQERGLRTAVDVGSGPGLKATRLLRNVVERLVLLDQPTTGEVAALHCRGAEFFPVDLERPQFQSAERFDLIVCSDVIEHLLDPGPCLSLIRCIASPNSLVIFSTPERDYRRGPQCDRCDKPEHVREWNGEEFAAMLADHGFAMTHHWLSPHLREPRARGDMTQFFLREFAACGGGAADPQCACQICECKVVPIPTL